MKKKIIIGNWKENPETLDVAKKLLTISNNFHNPNILITHAVPNIFAGILKSENKDLNIILQNISKFPGGSHTGEISSKQAKNIGFEMSIVGHSETRLSPSNPHGDEDNDVNQKIKNLLEEDMRVCLCIGEYTRDTDNGSPYLEFIKQQLENCLAGIEKEKMEKIIIAYEPIWAIGKNAVRPATDAEIVELTSFIKTFFHGAVLYGGSVDETNAKEILELNSVDGLLVGRASSDPVEWQKILNTFDKNIDMKYMTMDDLNIQVGDRVLLRLDLNVPTDDSGNITNTFRITESLPTILKLQDFGAKTIIIAHKEEGSLATVSDYLKSKVNNFSFANNLKEINIEEVKNGSVLLVENIRLDKREKSKSKDERDELGKELADLADFYINEAFSASHRDHASITSIPKFFPGDKKCLGPKFLNEIEKLTLALTPKHPMFLLVGGAKFDTKLPMLEKFLTISDKIFVGGALAHSFWKSKGYELGQSLLDEEVSLSEKVLSSDKIVLPSDVMIEDKTTKSPDQLTKEARIVDFGEKTLEQILNIARNSNTIVWNGPVDFYEKGFDWGTKMLIEEFSKMTDKTIILGGGDTVTEIDKVTEEKRKTDPGFQFHFTHVSTGGGAMIDFLSNGTLPGIEAIK